MVFAKIAQHPKVGAVHLRDVHESQVCLAPPFYLSGTEHPVTVGIDEYRNNELRVIGMLASVTVSAFQRRGVQLLKQIAIEMAFVIGREQVKNIAREEQALVEFHRA